MDFSDLAGRYLQARMDQATLPFTNPESYVNQRFGMNTNTSANTKPVTQTIKTDPATGEQEITIKGSAQDLSASNPNTPTIVPAQNQPKFNFPTSNSGYLNLANSASNQPVAYQPPSQVFQPAVPDTYQRMIQAESGGQNYAPNGQPLTSPKGAMFASQVMPSTAANPGYGVRPAQAQTPEEYNRVGQDYYNAMLRQFGGNEQAAIAAYNAGPGRVQQNIQSNNGQLNVAQLPQETQQYLQRVQAPVAAPAAPVAAPAAPVAAPATVQTPGPQPVIAGTPSSDVGLTPTEQALKQQQITWANELEQAQNDPTALYAIAGNKEKYPESIRQLARDKALDHDRRLQQETKAQKVAQGAAQGDPKYVNEMIRDIRTRSEEGSYLKAYLYSRLGLNDLAREEQEKLMGPKFAQALVDGTQYFVETKNGAIVNAYRPDGTKVASDNELAKINASYINPTKSETGADVYYNPMQANGPRFALVKTPTGATYREVGTGRPATAQEQAGLVKMSAAGPIEQQAATAYARAGAGVQGKAAGEGYTPNVLPPRPGTQAPVGTTMPSTTTTTLQPGTTTTTVTQPTPTTGYQSPTVSGGTTTQQNLPLYQQRIQSERGAKRGETVDKVIDTEYREEARAGDIVSNTRKQQFAIFDRPGINADRLFGLYNAAAEGVGDQKYSIIRDIIGGQFKSEAEVSQRLAQLDLSPQEKSALTEYNIANQRINAASLKQNSGPGSISDSEQKANREANVDITKVPALGAYNAMAQSQFTGDMARAKMDWAASQNFTNAAQMDKAWRKEQANLTTMYADIARQRAEWIASHGATTAAVKEGYKRFPIPEYDPNTESWKKTKPLNSYER